MNRRSFFKVVTGFVAGIFATSAKEKSQLTVAMLKKAKNELVAAQKKVEDNCWKFYINGKEIDSSRAVDELSVLHFPFQGAKKGDLCTFKSPKIFV